MSVLESRTRRSRRLSPPPAPPTPQRAAPRRIRQEAAETIVASGVSLAGSVAATLGLWLLLRWLT